MKRNSLILGFSTFAILFVSTAQANTELKCNGWVKSTEAEVEYSWYDPAPSIGIHNMEAHDPILKVFEKSETERLGSSPFSDWVKKGSFTETNSVSLEPTGENVYESYEEVPTPTRLDTEGKPEEGYEPTKSFSGYKEFTANILSIVLPHGADGAQEAVEGNCWLKVTEAESLEEVKELFKRHSEK